MQVQGPLSETVSHHLRYRDLVKLRVRFLRRSVISSLGVPVAIFSRYLDARLFLKDLSA